MPDRVPPAGPAPCPEHARTALSANARPEACHESLAPAWHTLVVLFVMLGVSLLGARARVPARLALHGRVASYLLVMLIEWATVAFIWWGLERRGLRLSTLIGGCWERRVHIVRDIGIGVAFVVLAGGAVQVLTDLLKAAPPPAVRAMMPQTVLEMIVWVPLCLTAGFCEEVIFRGYLQRQFSALTHSLLGGILVQAIAFGCSHGYQGWKLMSIIAIYGACFGFLAYWRRSLRPGMIGHALQDTAGGLLARFLAQ